MPRLRKVRALHPGSRIGIAAPAGPIDSDRLEAGEAMLRGMGFEPVRAGDVTARSGYLAGDDARRAAELSDLIGDPRVEAVVCARGGYGCHRIVDRLDPALFRAAAKPLVGYSDVTTLMLWQRRVAGLTSFHGPMLERADRLSQDAREALAAMLCGAIAGPLTGRSIAGGLAAGRIVGGSLSLLVASLGTPWELDTRGAILLFEDVGEPPYRVDRMLQCLRAAGKLGAAAAIGVGAMVDCMDTRYPSPSVDDVLQEILTPLGIPVLGALPFGHVDRNLPWAIGVRAELDAERGELRFLESGVTMRRKGEA